MTRLVPLADPEEALRWRAEVIGAVFGAAPSPQLLEANADYLRQHMADGTHRVVLACEDGAAAGCGALCIYDELPSPDNPLGRCGYLMSIYVRPPFRGRGIGSAIARWLAAEATRQGCGKIYLETTEAGRSVYAALGFAEMKDYMIYGLKTCQNR